MPTNNKTLFAYMYSAIALLPEMMQKHDVLCFVTTMLCIYFAAVDSMPYIHKQNGVRFRVSGIALLPEMMQNHDVLCFGKTMFL